MSLFTVPHKEAADPPLCCGVVPIGLRDISKHTFIRFLFQVMIYLIEGVLPEGYFANNLRGLSVDMAVFRDLLRVRLQNLSRHLDRLQNESKDSGRARAVVLKMFAWLLFKIHFANAGTSYEPPLTNVFTMQWFLTLFCNCLPQRTVLRVWDLIFLEGSTVLLKTALAIWDALSE